MGKFWKINNLNSQRAELIFYGDIADRDYWGDEITPRGFREDLATLKGKDIDLHINSGGGDVFAANAIHSALKQHQGQITAYIDGLCASAATIVACAAHKVIMPANALYMIHNPTASLCGSYEATELDTKSKLLQSAKQTIIATYKARGVNEQQATALMDAESWLTADEALAEGFVDEVVECYDLHNYILDDKLVMNGTTFELTSYKNTNNIRIKNKERVNVNENEILKKIKNLLGISESVENFPDTTVVENAAVIAERERVEALTKLKGDNAVVNAIVETAIKNGAKVEDIKDYVDIVSSLPQTKVDNYSVNALEAIRNLITDNMQSGATGVKRTIPTNSEEDIKNAGISEVVAYANKGR